MNKEKIIFDDELVDEDYLGDGFDEEALDEDSDFEEDNDFEEDYLEEELEEESFGEDRDFEGDYLDIEEEEMSADEAGSDVGLEEAGLMEEDDEYNVIQPGNLDFINDNGDIVVMEDNKDGNNFELIKVPIDKLVSAQKRIRQNKNVEDLVQSIKSTGLLNPVIVAPLETNGMYIIVDGFRRVYACARAGIRDIPCIVNKMVQTTDISILEAMYNQKKEYSMKEIIDFIDYLEKEKGIMSATLIEYLLQMKSGDYSKLKDILEDDDPDIVQKLEEGLFSIEQAFKALEKRRKQESREEQDLKKTTKVYSDTDESGTKSIEGSGETGDEGAALSDDEIQSLAINAEDLDDDIEDKSLDEMVEESKSMEGLGPHRQNPNEREIIDPAIRKAVMSRDKNTCQCCKRGGPDYVDILDLHHIVEVYLGGVDSVDNSIALCLNCHKQVHLFVYNQLHIPKTKTESELEVGLKQKILEENEKRVSEGLSDMNDNEEKEFSEIYYATYKAEQNKYKRIVKLGNVIRKGLQMKGMKIEKAKKEHPIGKIGRQMPGTKNTIA